MKLEYIADGAIDTPLIRLYAFLPNDILRLMDIAGVLAEGTIQAVLFNTEPGIEVVGKCRLTLRRGQVDAGIMQTANNEFDCTLQAEGWREFQDKVAAMNKPGSGTYQWLTREGKIAFLLSRTGNW